MGLLDEVLEGALVVRLHRLILVQKWTYINSISQRGFDVWIWAFLLVKLLPLFMVATQPSLGKAITSPSVRISETGSVRNLGSFL